MTKTELITLIKQEIADRFEKPLDTIGDDTNVLADLGADSLDMTEILVAIEDKLGVRVDDDNIERLGTAAELAQFLEGYLISIGYNATANN